MKRCHSELFADGICLEVATEALRIATPRARLLETLDIARQFPAWTSNRLKRLIQAPKRYVVAPALLGAVLGLDADGILRHGDS